MMSVINGVMLRKLVQLPVFVICPPCDEKLDVSFFSMLTTWREDQKIVSK